METKKEIAQASPVKDTMRSVASDVRWAAIVPGLCWFLSIKEPVVCSTRTAFNTGNLRFFSGRTAITLLAIGTIASITADAIEAYNRVPEKEGVRPK